jgi:hypothetical protein
MLRSSFAQFNRPLPHAVPTFVSFNNLDGRAEEIKLLTQTILQVPQKTKVQASLSTRREHYKRRRMHARLRDVLHVKARATKSLCRRHAGFLSDLTFKEFV